MKNIVFLLLIIVVFKAYTDPSIGIEVSTSIVVPKKEFKLHYETGYNFGFRTILSSESDNIIGLDVSLPYKFSLVRIKDTDKRAKINTVGIGVSTYLFFIHWGYDFLLGSFKIDEDIYNSNGQSTLTELKERNGKIQFGINRYISLRIPIGQYYSASYRLESTSLDYKFNLWHSLSSGLIKQVTILPFHIFSYVALGYYRIDVTAILYIIGISIAAAWYYNDYDHHNWDWDDPKPLNYTSHSFTFKFPIYYFWGKP